MKYCVHTPEPLSQQLTHVAQSSTAVLSHWVAFKDCGSYFAHVHEKKKRKKIQIYVDCI